jgi:hypothetical protein
MMQVIVWMLVCPFIMFVRGRDANKHTQHKTAQMIRQVGDSLGVLLFFLLCFSVGRLPREGFQMFYIAYCLGLALPPCGAESSCDTLPRARLGLRGSGSLCSCIWQVIFAISGDTSGVFRGL